MSNVISKVYVVVYEHSNEPCSADLKIYKSKKDALASLKNHLRGFCSVFPSLAFDATKSFNENNGESYGVTDEDGNDYYYRIEEHELL